MKILHIITRLVVGGAQENTILSCEGQAKAGHEVILVHGPTHGPEGSLLDRARAGGYRLIEIPELMRPLRPLTDWLGHRHLKRLIAELKPDVVHTHSSKAGILGRAAAWPLRVPAVVHTIHGLPFHPFQPAITHKLYVAAERWAARRCHRIVCVADAMSRQAIVEGVGARKQFVTVYSGMDTAPFLSAVDDRQATRAELGIGRDETVVGTVARLAELKGHDDLLEGLRPLLRRDPQLRLLWVGDGWWRPRLENKIDRMGLRGRVTITGLLDPSRIPAMMRAMNLLVHPSYREGLARAIPQALLCRTPVVSYDCDGAGEACADGKTGRLVPTGDIRALRDAVAWMLEHPRDAARMARTGQTLCSMRFSASTMVEALERVYRQILEPSVESI